MSIQCRRSKRYKGGNILKARLLIVTVVVLISISLIGCSNKEIYYESMAQHNELIEETEYGSINMTFSLLNGDDIRTFNAKAGKKYVFNYSYLITGGLISLQFLDSEDNVLDEILLSSDEYESEKAKLENEHEGAVNIDEFVSMTSITSKDDKIKILISGKDAKGKLLVKW